MKAGNLVCRYCPYEQRPTGEGLLTLMGHLKDYHKIKFGPPDGPFTHIQKLVERLVVRKCGDCEMFDEEKARCLVRYGVKFGSRACIKNRCGKIVKDMTWGEQESRGCRR